MNKLKINKTDYIYMMLAKASVGNISNDFYSISFSYKNSKLSIKFIVFKKNELVVDLIEDIIVDLEVQVESLKVISELGFELDSKWNVEVTIFENTEETTSNLENLIFLTTQTTI